MTSPFKIVPKNKKLLKSSKVRDWFKMINVIMEPEKKRIMAEVEQDFMDVIIYGRSRRKK